jgi:hypothetical protein
MKKITTASGATYLVDLEEHLIRRVNPAHEKRGDGEWQPLINYREPVIGREWYVVMESLIRYGQDDYGTPPEEATEYTTRRTTPIVSIEDVE